MGNTPLYEGPFEHVELTALAAPLVVFDERFVRPESAGSTRLLVANKASIRSAIDSIANLAFKDTTFHEVLFRTGPDAELRTLLDGAKKPIATFATKSNINYIVYAYRPDTAPQMTTTANGGFVLDASDESELLQIYVKLGEQIRKGYLPTELRVDFRDAATGERCKVEMEGEWRARSAVLWLERSSSGSGTRTPIVRVFRPKGTLRSDFFVDVVANADMALVSLVIAVVEAELKRQRRPLKPQSHH